jgi:glycosyltransferase involved in cell wall biosynthesis
MISCLTVIIPTRNRVSLLLKVVEALLEQSPDIDGHLEIIIVDDGSTVQVESALEKLVSTHQVEDQVRYFYQESKGPAAARNLGIREARGETILFLGDDILPLPGLLRAHLHAHLVEYPQLEVAVLGLADLAPEFCQTPFVNWWRRWNFRYQLLLEGKREPDFSFFYTNNLSAKRTLFLQNGMFDEEFSYAAYEDGELGARLERQGMRLIFKPEAQALHYHPIDLHSACQRMITRGKAYDLFLEKTGLPGMPKLWLTVGQGPWINPTIIRPLYRFADWLQFRGVVNLLYISVLMYSFEIGRGNKPLIVEVQ